MKTNLRASRKSRLLPPARRSPVGASSSSAPVSLRLRCSRRRPCSGARAERRRELVEGEPEAAKEQGYRLTDHVLRYYETTRS